MLPQNVPSEGEERGMSIVAWVLNLVVPILGPAIVYAIFAGRSKFVAFHALQSTLFGVAIWGAGAIAGLLTAVTCGIGGIVAIPAMIVIGLAGFIYTVVLAIKASSGEWAVAPIVGKWTRQILNV